MYIGQLIENQENKQPRKISERKIYVLYRNVRKVVPFPYELKKKIIYLAALKKGGIRHAHPYYAIYR